MTDLLFGNDASWFSIPAIIGTGYILIRITLMSIGLGEGGDVDGDISGDLGLDAGGDAGLDAIEADHHGDVDFSDSDYAFRLLSIQTIGTFIMGFGWGGLAAYKGIPLDVAPSIVIGTLVGAAFVWLLTSLLRFANGLQSSGTVSIRHAIGREGDVYVNIPANNSGSGQVRMTLNDRQRIWNAVTAGEAIATGTRVRVAKVNSDNTLTVTRVS